MPVDLRAILGNVLHLFKSRANQICAATCDGLVLRMHYRWTFCVLLGMFLTVWYSWYYRDVITCVSHFNAETQVRLDYINICLSYPFVEEGGGRRYLLFYRWISWALLVLAGVYYIPRKMSKNWDNARCKKLLEDLAANSSRYDQMERELVERAYQYIIMNLKTHNGLYWKFLAVNITALLVDIFAMQYLDFILQGRFIQYGFRSYPFTRDPRNFTDYMSQTFPPFASCELAKENQLTNKRTEKLGCHLTIMELYEKVFLGLWIWLILLTLTTCCYLIFLGLMWLPKVQLYLLRAAKPGHANEKVGGVVEAVCKNCKIGDVYLLYRLKQHLSHARFYELLARLSSPNLYNKPAVPGAPELTTMDKGGKGGVPQGRQQVPDTLRQRGANMPGAPPLMNQNYYNQLLANPAMMQQPGAPGMMPPGSHPMPQHHIQPQHNNKDNTKILVD